MQLLFIRVNLDNPVILQHLPRNVNNLRGKTCHTSRSATKAKVTTIFLICFLLSNIALALSVRCRLGLAGPIIDQGLSATTAMLNQAGLCVTG